MGANVQQSVEQLQAAVTTLLAAHQAQRVRIQELEAANAQLEQLLAGRVALGKRGGNVMDIQQCIAIIDRCIQHLDNTATTTG